LAEREGEVEVASSVCQ